MDRAEIIGRIRELAADNGGRAPGQAAFANATGITDAAWCGKYWARWSDAVAEAGLTPNEYNQAIPAEEICRHFLEACRRFGREPTMNELRMYARGTAGAPSHNVWTRQFGGKDQLVSAARDFALNSQSYEDVLPFLRASKAGQSIATTSADNTDGWVYLLKSGQYYKIGRSDNIERRIKEITISLPEHVTLVHAIRTDDPNGIEAYWHSRFAEKRAKGEWFQLERSDIKAFRRRKFM